MGAAVRILLLTPFLPCARASHGGGSYVGSICDALRRRAELGLLHIKHPGEAAAEQADWSWIGSAEYQGAPGGPGQRLRMLWQWRKQPLLIAKYGSAKIAGLIERARSEFQPDVVLVELAQMAQYLPQLGGLPVILTDHEAGLPANAGTGMGAWADRRDERLWRRYVQQSYGHADMIQAVTQDDAETLQSVLGCEVHVRPPALTPPTLACEPAQTKKTALFLGDYRHAPNQQAAHRLVTRIWPLVRARCPDAELILAGPNPDPIQSLHGHPGVRVLGFVEDLRELMGAARLVLAPLWSGGGFRVKNATALLAGLPVVTNSLGARGCRAPEPACVVREEPATLADAACALLTSPAAAGEAGALARSWAIEQFSADAVADLQLRRIEKLVHPD